MTHLFKCWCEEKRCESEEAATFSAECSEKERGAGDEERIEGKSR